MEINKIITKLLSDVKEHNPLVYHITNYVTVNDCANIVLALGGSPVMADDQNEVEEMVSIASALVLNMGTLNQRTIESMILAGKKANELGIPVIFDPVGVGATNLRTETANRILNEVKLSVVTGNMSEIKILAGLNTTVKGVDSTDGTVGGEKIAAELAAKLNSVIAITGATDIISNGKKTYKLNNGHEILSKVTGTGCMTTSLIGTYAGVTKDYLLAATAGIMSMGLTGEKAYQQLASSDGIGTFKVRIFDNIYNLSEKDIIQGGKLNEC